MGIPRAARDDGVVNPAAHALTAASNLVWRVAVWRNMTIVWPLAGRNPQNRTDELLVVLYGLPSCS